ncbi:FCD domain-containing protein [Jatrophihabitans sp.]|uniref:FadR/GntR family transcriptional regulator n=1 Tax=Jatrophihabitans sp. TaxID=1932789 RepID=UPI0030C76A46|nr:regulatory protein GntR [Jatrophihabitans sp.]
MAEPQWSPVAVPERADSQRALRPPKTAELVAQSLRRRIVRGELRDGDFLPHEAQLMDIFRVSRPTLREAVRVLESDRLVEVRRGSRTGARVCVPGPEIVARPAGLLLELAGATLDDVYTARSLVEPAAARLLAESGGGSAHATLAAMLVEVPARDELPALARFAADFHLALVQLSGNATLAIVAGMLHEITDRQTEAALTTSPALTGQRYRRLLRSYERLVELVRARDGVGAEAHWREHMAASGALLLQGHRDTPVVDLLD